MKIKNYLPGDVVYFRREPFVTTVGRVMRRTHRVLEEVWLIHCLRTDKVFVLRGDYPAWQTADQLDRLVAKGDVQLLFDYANIARQHKRVA